jgi:hypothetical protein
MDISSRRRNPYMFAARILQPVTMVDIFQTYVVGGLRWIGGDGLVVMECV